MAARLQASPLVDSINPAPIGTLSGRGIDLSDTVRACASESASSAHDSVSSRDQI